MSSRINPGYRVSGRRLHGRSGWKRWSEGGKNSLENASPGRSHRGRHHHPCEAGRAKRRTASRRASNRSRKCERYTIRTMQKNRTSLWVSFHHDHFRCRPGRGSGDGDGETLNLESRPARVHS